jgi:phage replication-related protein YjqB (UPF0714/DUF867 family)
MGPLVRPKKYASLAELARHEVEGRDFRIVTRRRPRSAVLLVAPHGGSIEAGTSEIAAMAAGEEHNLFCFEGLKPRGENRALHITSHKFDQPECLALAAACEVVVTVHGCLGDSQVHIGGLDDELAVRLSLALRAARFSVDYPSARYPGRHPLNICNRGARAKGVQVEISHDLRTGESRGLIAHAIRTELAGLAAPSYMGREPGVRPVGSLSADTP